MLDCKSVELEECKSENLEECKIGVRLEECKIRRFWDWKSVRLEKFEVWDWKSVRLEVCEIGRM